MAKDWNLVQRSTFKICQKLRPEQGGAHPMFRGVGHEYFGQYGVDCGWDEWDWAGAGGALHGKGNQVIIAGRRQELLDEIVAAHEGME